MALKDRDNFYAGLGTAPTPSDKQVPNTVSRNAKVGDRSFHQVVAEAGKPVLDSELNLNQEIQWQHQNRLRRWQVPSGWLRGVGKGDSYCDYITGNAPDGFQDNTEEHLSDSVLLDSFILPRLEAVVAGHHVHVEFTNTSTANSNLIALQEPSIYDGTNTTVKRTDFVFLEVWRALVAPSPKAEGELQVDDVEDISPGDTLTIGGWDLTAVAAAPGVDEFLIGGTNEETATNIETALNDPDNSFVDMVTAIAVGDVVTLRAILPGEAGNGITLADASAGLSVSGPNLTGGEDRPNKPSQFQLYRHGNTQSADDTWLADELTDPAIDVETSQRVQIQYRIRVTGEDEAVNWKKHPDGFSSLSSGDPVIFARGGRNVPVYDGNGEGDGQSYPFVRADASSTWLDSSAVAYGDTDDGLWVAGDGSAQAAQDLCTLDGFVYAIPLCFVFRHNNVSDSLGGFKGFDPENNANGAPMWDHEGYEGPLGTIAAGASDRPDGHFANVISIDQILDLRKHVSMQGVNLAGELQHQIQALLDGSLRTWAIDTASKQDLGGDSGDVSTRPLVCNEIGRSLAVGGNAPTSGDTGRGVFIRNFDHICRRFSEQPVTERVVFAFYPGDRPTLGAQGGVAGAGLVNPGKYVVKAEFEGDPKDDDSWYEGDILHLDLEELDATTLGGLFQGLSGGTSSGVGLPDTNFASMAPVGTVITDILGIWHDDGHYTTAVDQSVQMKWAKGLGTQHLEICLDANDAVVNGGDSGNADYRMVGSDVDEVVTPTGSERRIFLEVEITYPVAVGTTDTVYEVLAPDEDVYDGSGAGPGPVIETSVTQRPNDYETLVTPRFREGYREIQLEYVANDTDSTGGEGNSGSPVGSVNTEQIVSRNRTSLYFPRRVYGAASGPLAGQTVVEDAVASSTKSVDEDETDFGSSSRKVVVTSNLSGTGQTLCNIQYFAQDPVPNYGVSGGGYQVAVYFRTHAPQTAGVKEGDITTSGDGVLPTTLQVEPLYISESVLTGQVGQGSNERGFPYLTPLEQIPINDGSSLDGDGVAGTIGEWYFEATANVTVDDFNANTGLLSLHTFVQADAQNVQEFGGTGNGEKPRKDAEFRAYYPFADDSTYRPTVLSQPLYGATRHKVMVPMLARIVEDVPGVAGGLLFRKSEVVLVVLSRFAELDDENTVKFLDAANRTCAAVYKTKNLLMVVGDRTTCLAS